jgi:PAS domain S-box-containing protein
MNTPLKKEKAVRKALFTSGIIQNNSYQSYLNIGIFSSLALLIILTVLTLIDPHFFWEHSVVINYPLHSTIETIGAVSAIIMAFLSLEIFAKKINPSYVFISFGFLAMGIWDMFHAIVSPGNGFVLTHSLALLSGGLFFFLSIFPAGDTLVRKKALALFFTAVVFVSAAVSTIIFRQHLPRMIGDGGEFTLIADVINIAAGILFFITAIKLAVDYYKHRVPGLTVLIFVATLSAMAGLTFHYSHAWTDHWWFWHVLRLCAHVSLVVYLLVEFFRSMRERSAAILLFEQKNDELTASEQKLKALNQELMANQKNLASVLDSLPGIFYQIDTEGHYKRWNNRFLEVTGYTDEDMQTINAVDFFRGDDITDVAKAMETVFMDGEAEVEADLYLKSGESIPYLFTGIQFEIEGNPYILGMGLDISNLKTTQAELTRTVKELEIFNKMAVGRELRMVELKAKINSLSAELGKEAPYDLEFAEQDR